MFMPPYGGVNFPYKTNLNWIVCQILDLKERTGSLEQALKEFQEKFASELDQTVKDQLTVWLNDGTLGGMIQSLVSDFYWIDVTKFGVKNDGITDCTEALQNCIHDNGNNKLIYFPPGTYILNDVVYVDQSTTLFGHNALLKIKNGGLRIASNNVTIFGLSFDGLDNTTAAITYHNETVNNVSVVNCSFSNCETTINVSGYNWHVSDNILTNSNTGILIESGHTAIIANNYIGTAKTYVGIIARNCENCIIAKNTINNTADFGIFAQKSNNINIVDNIITSTVKEAINAQDSSEVLIANNICEWYSNSTDFGISTYTTEGATININIKNNIITGSEKAGIAITANSEGCTAEGNTLRSCRQNRLQQDNVDAQIYVYGTPSRASIKNNTIYCDYGTNKKCIVITGMNNGLVIGNTQYGVTMTNDYNDCAHALNYSNQAEI